MVRAAELPAMRRAVELSAAGLGRTSPNPVVGAVVLDPAGQVVGEGFHARAGGPHAEVLALHAAGRRAAGGTLVVTLEPCARTGRTPPCAEAVLRAGIRRVVYAVPDPTGGGAAVLTAAGVAVQGGVHAAAAARVNEAWLTAQHLHRPHVTWKFAATLDGRLAAPDGSSRWVTGPAARADGHALRARVDAVVVGVGTLLTDDPALTVRGQPGQRRPLRVVVEGGRRTPPSARLWQHRGPVLLARPAAGPAPPGADVAVLPGPGDRVPPATLLDVLAGMGVVAVLLEGGPTLAGSFVRAGLVDRVVGYYAPKLLGGGPPVLRDLGVPTVAGALPVTVDEVDRLGDDLRVSGRLVVPAAAARPAVQSVAAVGGR